MKKLILSLCMLICLTGCLKKEEYAIYESHKYVSISGYEEIVVAKYKEDGSLKSFEMSIKKDASCEELLKENKTATDLTYKDVNYACEYKDSKALIKISFTDKSIEDGYLVDGRESDLEMTNIYGNYKNEEEAKKFLERRVKLYRNDGVFNNNKTYIIIDGEKISK